MKTADKFHNSNGTLTAYAFACGYIERKETENLRLDLWHEGACYHVKAHEFNGRGRLTWESFDGLAAARRHFAFLKNIYFPKVQA